MRGFERKAAEPKGVCVGMDEIKVPLFKIRAPVNLIMLVSEC